MMDNEIINSIEYVIFYEKYRIDKLGKILNIESNKYLKPNSCLKYLTYALYENGKQKRCLLHRLLAEAFIIKPENKHLVLHRDDNPINNELENLYWGDRSDNMKDRYKNGYNPKGEKHPAAKLNNQDVRNIRQLLMTTNMTFKEIENKYKVHLMTISRIKNNENWNHIS